MVGEGGMGGDLVEQPDETGESLLQGRVGSGEAVLGVSLWDMLIHSGRVTEQDLPLPGAARAAGEGEAAARPVTPEEAATLLGIPGSHRRQFIEMTEMILAVSGGAATVGRATDGGRRGVSNRR
ncbi:hypothetical protein I5Q34_12770 [Streptomyces sp. AV19]|uniref:hypothetical protein n=1 Tax=Streptomyces sp. AV19 TaxID=2793068 RepID=UPI0018FE2733|nr:hypothetical protein [Streptomyces sp. AV19]MBH1935135.1 hypothetical protein [Streptomyces sp. AV19]MDG4531067.1 hypothetical protein [Streptomyces sp. AV19]